MGCFLKRGLFPLRISRNVKIWRNACFLNRRITDLVSKSPCSTIARGCRPANGTFISCVRRGISSIFLLIQFFILFLSSRSLAESSPYFEAVKEKNLEVLFCYEPYDELLMIQLQQFDRKNLTSVEKQVWRDKSSTTTTPESKIDKISLSIHVMNLNFI